MHQCYNIGFYIPFKKFYEVHKIDKMLFNITKIKDLIATWSDLVNIFVMMMSDKQIQ